MSLSLMAKIPFPQQFPQKSYHSNRREESPKFTRMLKKIREFPAFKFTQVVKTYLLLTIQQWHANEKGSF